MSDDEIVQDGIVLAIKYSKSPVYNHASLKQLFKEIEEILDKLIQKTQRKNLNNN